MLKDYWGEIPDGPEARDWVRNIMDRAIWTVKEVQGIYGLSQSTVSRLYTKHDWKFAFKKGNQILFLADYAKPWFDQYNAEQNINRSAEQVDPVTGKRKPGRSKKAKGEYEYQLFGQVYKSTNPPAEERGNWRGYIASQWPQYFTDGSGERAHGYVVTNPDAYPEYFEVVLPKLGEIDKVFRKLIAEKMK